MEGPTTERQLIIASRPADNYQLSEVGLKNLQHLLTTWFPRAIYDDLTDDTVKVSVVVRRGVISGKNVFKASFIRSDGSVAKTLDYDEDRIVGRVCQHYDQSKHSYVGKQDGYDHRIVHYR